MGFWDEIKESAKEGWEEGKAELEEEEKAQQKEEQDKHRFTLEKIASLPYEEKFAMCLAAPFRVTLYFDWYTIFKDDDSEDDLYPLHLYTFGDPEVTTEEHRKQHREYIERDFGITDRESAIGEIAELLVRADIPLTEGFFVLPEATEDIPRYSISEDLGPFDETAVALRTLTSSMAALAITSAVDSGYLGKNEVMATLSDIGLFVRSLLANASDYAEPDWNRFADIFLAGEKTVELNKKKGRKVLLKFVGYLREKKGSPWNNLDFLREGEELLYENVVPFKPDRSGIRPYTEDELDLLRAHIVRYIGEYDIVYGEDHSTDINIGIALIEPSAKENRISLVTLGAGALLMNVPDELTGDKLDRMELMISLAPDWNIDGEEPEDFWPMEVIKDLVHYALEEKTWLGFGHTVNFGKGFVSGVDYAGVLLTFPLARNTSAQVLPLSKEDDINFYQVIPLLEDEMEYKVEYGTEKLLKKFFKRYGKSWDGTVDPNRTSVLKRR